MILQRVEEVYIQKCLNWMSFGLFIKSNVKLKWIEGTYGCVVMLIDVSYVELFTSKLKNLEIWVIIVLIHAQNFNDCLIFAEQKLEVRWFVGLEFLRRRCCNVHGRLS